MKRSALTIMGRLIALVRPLSGHMFLAISLGLLGQLALTFISILAGYALLALLGVKLAVSPGLLLSLAAALALLRGLFRYGEQLCNHYIAFKLLALIRAQVFRALRRLCPAKLEGRDKGDLIAVITSDIELLEVFYAHTISPVAIALLFSLILVLFIGSFHIFQGLLALLAYLVLGLLIPLLSSRFSGTGAQEWRQKSGALAAFVLDSLRGLDEILQYGQGPQRLAEMGRRGAELAADERRMKRRSACNQALTGASILVFDLLMILVSIGLYRRGQLGLPGLLLPPLALMSSYAPTVALAALGSGLQNTFAAANRVLDILDEQPVVEEVQGQKPVRFHDVQVAGVSFSYGAEQVLEDFSLDIPAHSILGISGRSGSGKSTLLKLLMRFWEPDAGQIRISGRELGQINTSELRAMEGFVTQDTQLFRDSIRSNLRLARLDASDAEIEEACRKAAIHDFIQSLPQGYDSPVGELGSCLSGGERQRIGLARAFLHGAELLLLDEPTSNLDSLNEALILRSIAEERADRCIVLVSHRPSTLRIAEQICQVQRGQSS